jgi:hypothetical protein
MLRGRGGLARTRCVMALGLGWMDSQSSLTARGRGLIAGCADTNQPRLREKLGPSAPIQADGAAKLHCGSRIFFLPAPISHRSGAFPILVFPFMRTVHSNSLSLASTGGCWVLSAGPAMSLILWSSNLLGCVQKEVDHEDFFHMHWIFTDRSSKYIL